MGLKQVASDGRHWNEQKKLDGAKLTRKKQRRINTAGYVGMAAGGIGAPALMLAGSRGVNAGRGAVWAAKNARGRYHVGRLAARAGAKVPNQRTEEYGLGIAAIAGLNGGAQYGARRETRRQYPGYKATMHGLRPVDRKVKKSMSASVWGVDHNEISKAFGSFKPILNKPMKPMAAPTPSVKNGLKQVQAMPKPMGVPKPPTQPGLQRAAGAKKFGNTSGLSARLGVKKNMEIDMSHSVWGVDHGPSEISKKEHQASSGKASGSRLATAAAVGPVHGLVAGRKGKKWRAAGNEFGGGFVGGSAGLAVNAATKGKAAWAPTVGQMSGAAYGANRANKKGYLKAQSR